MCNTVSMYKRKWGVHYARSLLCAHKLQQVYLCECCPVATCARTHAVQQCHNYKDPSVQLYGGAMFKVTPDSVFQSHNNTFVKAIVEAADAAFCSLPAPTSTSSASSSSSSSAPQAPVDMSMCVHCCNHDAASLHASTGSWTVTEAALLHSRPFNLLTVRSLKYNSSARECAFGEEHVSSTCCALTIMLLFQWLRCRALEVEMSPSRICS